MSTTRVLRRYAMQCRLGLVSSAVGSEAIFTPCDGCAQPDHCGGTWPEDDRHKPGQVRGCFAAKARGVKLRADNMPFTAREKVMASDNDAYRRLRKDGIQPPKVDGSAHLEKAL